MSEIPIEKIRAEIAAVLPPTFAGDLAALPDEGLRRLHAKHLVAPPVRRTVRIVGRSKRP